MPVTSAGSWLFGLSSDRHVYMWLRMLAYEVTQFLLVLCSVVAGYVFCLAERTVSYAGQPFGDQINIIRLLMQSFLIGLTRHKVYVSECGDPDSQTPHDRWLNHRSGKLTCGRSRSQLTVHSRQGRRVRQTVSSSDPQPSPGLRSSA